MKKYGKGSLILLRRIKQLAEDNGRTLHIKGKVYFTADKYDGCDAYYSMSLKELLKWEEGYKNDI